MKLLQDHGNARTQFDGLGSLETETGTIDVYFEALQRDDADLVVGLMSPAIMNLFESAKLDGVTHSPPGDVRARGLLSTFVGVSGDISRGISRARHIHVEYRDVPQTRALQLSIPNLRYSRDAPAFPVTATRIGDYEFEFTPVDDYEQTVASLRAAGGVKVTAVCKVKRADGGSLSVPIALLTADFLCALISLSRGNKTAWLDYDAYLDKMHCRTGYRSTVTKPFSTRSMALGFELSLASCFAAWSKAKLSRERQRYLLRMIDYYIDAVSPHSFLEANGLTAAALVDALTNHYTATLGATFHLPEEQWEPLKPLIEECIKSATAKQGVSEDLTKSLPALNRTPIRANLNKMLDDLKLPKGHVHRLLQVRNALVHDGSFPSPGDKLQDYRLLLWTAFAVLMRLTGFDGAIPAP